MRHQSQAIAEQNTAHNQHLSQQITHHSLALSRQAMVQNQQIYTEMATGNRFPVITVSVAVTQKLRILSPTYNNLIYHTRLIKNFQKYMVLLLTNM